jgi:hypothetical protein
VVIPRRVLAGPLSEPWLLRPARRWDV